MSVQVGLGDRPLHGYLEHYWQHIVGAFCHLRAATAAWYKADKIRHKHEQSIDLFVRVEIFFLSDLVELLD